MNPAAVSGRDVWDIPGGCGTQVAARSAKVDVVAEAGVDAEESAMARASAESKI